MTVGANIHQIVLASGSETRRSVLEKLKLKFVTQAPAIDESPLPGESPEELVKRLSCEKAKAVSEKFSNHLIIGSDQVAVVDGKITGKPASRSMMRLRQLDRSIRANGYAPYWASLTEFAIGKSAS